MLAHLAKGSVARRDDPAPVSAPGDGVQVLVQRLDPEAPLPTYALPGDAGADIVTTIDVVLGPGERAVLPTGVAVALPDGYAAFRASTVRARSSRRDWRC